jgi:hypothetical protein
VTRPPAIDPGKTGAGEYNPTDPTKEPGMGGKPPDIAGATQAGAQRTGAGRSPGGTEGAPSQSLGGGEVTRIPTAEPPGRRPGAPARSGRRLVVLFGPDPGVVSSPHGPLPAVQLEAAARTRL